MPKFMDTLDMGEKGLVFSDASTLGITSSSDQSAYPQGVIAFSVLKADGWPADGSLMAANLAPWRFSQMLVAADGMSVFIRTITGNGPALEQWRTVYSTTWETPTLINGWANYGSGFAPAGYKKEHGDTVHLRGLIRNGTVNAGAFVLPEGYRPPHRLIVAAVGYSRAFASVRIYETGSVVPYTPTDNRWVSLSGISFHTS